jgi:rhamnose utilization protein RhaD (predicted bifunctional aldolase and dehydrogenase)/NAD(P)-dependent dehydrogenase (short-subunit alcohol dehydrogenase family)
MDNLWREEEAARLSGLDLLVYRSHLIGRNPGLVLWGGGNTSIKQVEGDFRGRDVRVMRIKGSGSDLRTIEPKHFPGIRLEDLEPLIDRDSMSDDEMVAYLVHCLMEPAAPRPSIETLLHGFVPHPHIDHTHADAILSLTNTPDGKRHVEEVYGAEAALVAYRRPGFRLSREVAEALRRHPKARCVVLEKHGLITWGATAKESYDATIEMNSRAEEYARDRHRGRAVFGAVAPTPLDGSERRRVVAAVAPFLRGLLSGRPSPAGKGTAAPPSVPGGEGGVGRAPRVVLRFDDSEDVLEFVGSEAGPQICLAGPATPDHLLYTKPRPLFVQGIAPGTLRTPAGLEALRQALGVELQKHVSWYDLYFKKNSSGAESRLEPFPRVVLVPGVGMITAWKDARHTRIVSDIYHHTIAVMRGAQSIAEYRSLAVKDTFEVEYWPMELYKLTLAPPEKDLAGRVALITGAASGIGRAIAWRLAAEGCHVVVTDLAAERVGGLAREICERHGADRAIGVPMDVTSEENVRAAFAEATVAYGGLDLLVSNAGIAHSSPIDRMNLRDWTRSLEVNATGHFLVAREGMRILQEQGLGGALVFIASKNVLAPGKDFGAYSAAKAAEVQLARILAIEGGEHGIRVNIVNPDAVFQDSGLWSEAVREERARAHGIRSEDLEEFYRGRNLLKVRVTAEDVAEAALWLASDRSAKTTGCILTTDGGLREAFPR